MMRTKKRGGHNGREKNQTNFSESKRGKNYGKKKPRWRVALLGAWRGGTWEHHEVGVIDRDFVKIL